MNTADERRLRGWISSGINDTHALVEIAPHRTPGWTGSLLGDAARTAFDPKSTWTTYKALGSCGPRGQTAHADLSTCKHGAVKLLEDQADDVGAAVITVDGCGYNHYRVFACSEDIGMQPASQLEVPLSLLAPDDGPRRCNSISCAGRPGIALLGVADKAYQSQFSAQIQSLRCYADRHRYEMHVLDGSDYEGCHAIEEVMFRKHCTVAAWLEH